LPPARGSLSEHVIATLARPATGSGVTLSFVPPDDADDEQLALLLLQQPSYRPVEGVDPAWEDQPSFLLLREQLEHTMEQRLRDGVAVPTCTPAEVPDALVAMIDGAGGPSLSAWVEDNATLSHLQELVVHRSVFQLQEADHHSFAIPRLAEGPAKTALMEMQIDEYGGHEPTEAHAALFAHTMDAVGVDPRGGPDLDRVPAVTLATNTLLNRLGRSRRLVGACLGHLAVFEMTSVEPMAHYAAAFRRVLGGSGADDAEETATRAARFFDVHVAADGLHGRIALERMIHGFVDPYPADAPEVLFGAAALLHLEEAFTHHVLGNWQAGRSSLR
jgi:hypothetical protein